MSYTPQFLPKVNAIVVLYLKDVGLKNKYAIGILFVKMGLKNGIYQM